MAYSGNNRIIAGTLNSAAATTFRLESFYSTAEDPTHYGEGESFLGSYTVTTNLSGTVSFT